MFSQMRSRDSKELGCLFGELQGLGYQNAQSLYCKIVVEVIVISCFDLIKLRKGMLQAFESEMSPEDSSPSSPKESRVLSLPELDWRSDVRKRRLGTKKKVPFLKLMNRK